MLGSPILIFFAAQLDEARNRLAAEAEKRDEKIEAIKKMIEVEKQKFVATINERLESMIRDVVINKVKERVKTQVGLCVEMHRELLLTVLPKMAQFVEPYRKVLQGRKGRTMRIQMFLANV